MPADKALTPAQIAKLPRTPADRERGWRWVHLYRARLQKHAMKTLAGLYEDPKSPSYNPDADRTWQDCTMKTRAALVMAKDMGLTAEKETGEGRVLGIVVLQARADSIPTWEAEARRVDEEERRKANAIDAVVDAPRGGTDVPR
jgi:hypothetical protein